MTIPFRGNSLLAAMLCFAAVMGAQSPSSISFVEVKNVYLLPMPGGLDQYLALRLTETGGFQVVTDPQKAEAVLTDRIGGDFEDSLKELYAPKETKSDSAKLGETSLMPTQHMRPLSRGKGAVFLVDRYSGNVLWSTSDQPKSSQMADVKRSAEIIIKRLNESQAKARKAK